MRSFHSFQFCGSSKMTNLSLLVVALAIAGVYGEESIQKITMNKMDIEMNSNPYFDTFTGSFSPGGETLSLKTPVKKDLPSSLMVKILITTSGVALPETDMPLCEAFTDRAVGADIFAAGIPKGKFPKGCPVGVLIGIASCWKKYIQKYSIENGPIYRSACDAEIPRSAREDSYKIYKQAVYKQFFQGEDFGIDQYQFPPDKVPVGTPPGPASGKFSIYESGMDPYVTISVEGQLETMMPDGGVPEMKPPGFG